MAIRRLSRWPAWGVLRAEVLVRRQVARRWLEETDRELSSTLARRRLLIERIDACTMALAGSSGLGRRSRSLASADAEVLRMLERSADPAHATAPAPAPAPETETCGLDPQQIPSEPLSGRALCRIAVALVLAAGMPLELTEILRLLVLDGVVVAGRPSQTLSNALRSAVARGEIVRLGPGRYAPAPALSDRSR